MSKIKGGYYIKARCIQESEIQHAPPHFREIWDWLLKEANHQDTKYGKFTVKRGQCFRTYQDIRDGLSWNVGYRKERYSENQTKKAMKFLRDTLMIDTTKELGGVLITICNYEHYQNPKNYERTKERTTEGTNGEPMGNQGGTDNNKNGKKEENVKNIYGEFENVKLTEDEYKKLSTKFNGSLTEKIENLSGYKKSTGKKYKDDYATILNWARKEEKEQPKSPYKKLS